LSDLLVMRVLIASNWVLVIIWNWVLVVIGCVLWLVVIGCYLF
jgi:hypothetical protein